MWWSCPGWPHSSLPSPWPCLGSRGRRQSCPSYSFLRSYQPATDEAQTPFDIWWKNLHRIEKQMAWRWLHLVHPVHLEVVALPVVVAHLLHSLDAKEGEDSWHGSTTGTWVHSRVPGNRNASSHVFKCSAHKPMRNMCTWWAVNSKTTEKLKVILKIPPLTSPYGL